MANEKNLRRYALKKLVDEAKELWPNLDEHELAMLLIGADWGYQKAVNEMHMKLFGMTKDEERNDTKATD